MLNYESKSADALKAFKSPVPGSTRTEGIAIDRRRSGVAQFRQDRRDHPAAAGPRRAPHFLQSRCLESLCHGAGKARTARHRHVETSVHREDRRGARLPGRRRRRVLRRQQALVPDLHGLVQAHHRRRGERHADQDGLVAEAVSARHRHSRRDRPRAVDQHRPRDGSRRRRRNHHRGGSEHRQRALTHKVSNKPSPSGEAPVEILFVPGANPPIAYVTNMFGGTLWTATWNAQKKDFDVAQVFDFATVKAGVPLEIYFNGANDKMYVTTAKPGHLHIFDIKDPAKPTTDEDDRDGRRRASCRDHQGREARLRAELVAQSAGHERRLDHRHRPRQGRGDRQHQDAAASRASTRTPSCSCRNGIIRPGIRHRFIKATARRSSRAVLLTGLRYAVVLCNTPRARKIFVIMSLIS